MQYRIYQHGRYTQAMMYKTLHEVPFSLNLKNDCCFSFPSKSSDGHGSNGSDECQNKQTVGDKTMKKMNVSERYNSWQL